MARIVSLPGIVPPTRFDGAPWVSAHVQEAQTPDAEWVDIESVGLDPLDPNPSAPQVRNVTTTQAQLPTGWYRIVFFDAGEGQSEPSEVVRSSIESPLPPSLDDVRVASPLLRLKFPQPATDPEQFGDLRRIVYQATALVQAMTWRIIDRTLGCPAPAGESCEVTPNELAPVAVQAIVRMAERIVVTTEPVFAEQMATGRRLRGFSAGPYCVPMDTEALTDRGWRSYGDLCVGDLVLGYDAEAGVARWTPITKIIAPVEAEIVRIGPKRFGLRCTPEHRWLTRRRPTGQAYVPGQWGEWGLTAARDLIGRRDFDLMLTCPAETEHRLDITPAEAALIAWLWTDGHVERRAPGETHKTWIRGTIYQKHYREAVEGVLGDTGAPHTVVLDACDEDYARYRLRSPWLRELWERAQLDVLAPVEFVLALGTEAREAFLEAGLLAEGSLATASGRRPERSPVGRWYRWQFAQNEGPILDAFVLAAHLCGYGARVWRSLSRCKGFVLGRAIHSGQSIRVRPVGREMVWCVQTELGSWTIRQGNTIALTGNSESYFAPGEFARRGAQQGRPPVDQDDALDQALWALMTEDARDYFVWRSTGVAPPTAVATAFDYRRAHLGYGAGSLGGWPARSGPDGW